MKREKWRVDVETLNIVNQLLPGASAWGAEDL